MIPDVKYPYMPSDRHFKYAPYDHPFMIEAARARSEQSGDPSYPVGVVLVKDGVVIARAGNGFNKGAGQIHVCPRVVLECPSGTGYDLCHLHDPEGHAEQMVIAEAERLGVDPSGADTYMFGHWWACEPCWKKLIDAGVRDLYVVDDSHERFSRDKVYAETISGTREDYRVEQEGNIHRIYIPESVEPVYTFEESDPEIVARRIKNIVRQL